MLPIKYLRMRTPYERKNGPDRREWADRDQFFGVRPLASNATRQSRSRRLRWRRSIGLNKKRHKRHLFPEKQRPAQFVVRGKRADEISRLAADTHDLWEREILFKIASQWQLIAVHRAVERRPTILKIVPGKPHRE